MWWSVPEGVTEFDTWRELTTVYHEGVPGHHLQIAQTVYRAELLNRWRRLASWISGHGEGWALYAERLMADLGYLDDPADCLGMLDGQSMRAARVVLDIGVHCGFPAPAEVGRRRVELRQGLGVPDRPLPTWPRASCASSSTATSAGPARRRRTRSANGCGCSCAMMCRPARARRSTSLPSTAGRWTSARSVSTCSAPRS